MSHLEFSFRDTKGTLTNFIVMQIATKMILSTERLHQKLLEWINTFCKEAVNEIKLLAYFHCNYNFLNINIFN